MFQEFRHIRLQEITSVTHLLTPAQLQAQVGLHSPAADVMTDFEHTEPVTVSQNMQANEALEYMKHQHVRLLFTLDESGAVAGIISARDIMGRRVISCMEARGLAREDVQVKHIMMPRDQLQALTHEQVQHAKIGDIMLTLKGSGGQHVLVIDTSLAGVKRIRGIISASDISRLLKIGFDVMYEAKSFADIERVLGHGVEV